MRNNKGQFITGSTPTNKKVGIIIQCKNCAKDFIVQPYRKLTAIFCSPQCRAVFNNQRENHPSWSGGKPKCLECGKELSNYNNKKCSKHSTLCGEKNPKWIKDRTQLAKRQERNDMAYKEWRRQVWVRDNFKCKIGNCDCKGKIIAHHILGWSKFPELRYEVNNGITLCQFHHPLKRNDEKKLSPYFQELVGVKVN